MSDPIENYLHSLKRALAGEDPATVQDALADTEEHLREALAESAGEGDVTGLLDAFGSPEEVAEAWRAQPLLPRPRVSPGPMPPPVVPTFFGVLGVRRAWTSLLYFLLQIGMGPFYGLWVVMGVLTSAGLMVLVVGPPFLLAFLLSCRALMVGEGRLVEAMLDVRMPRRPVLLPVGRDRIRRALKDATTRRGLGYMFLALPLGLASSTLFLVLLMVSVVAALAPLLHYCFRIHVVMGSAGEVTSPFAVFGLSLLGGFLLLLTLHLAWWAGRLQAGFLRFMLVQRDPS